MRDRPVPRWPTASFRRIAHALFLSLLQPVIPMAIFVGLGPMLFRGGDELVTPGPLTFVAVAVVGALLLALLVGGGLLWLGGVTADALGWRRDEVGREVLLGMGGLAVYLACFAAIVWVGRPDADRIFRAVVAQSPAERALFLLVGLSIALFEEPVFRGYLQPALIERSGQAAGIALTALLFAAWHPPHFGFTGFLVRLSLGLVTGGLRGRDRSLTAAIVTHTLLWPVLGTS